MDTSDVLAENMDAVACTINEVVGYYAKRTGYWYDERDLAQKAWLVALTTVSTWSPEKGPLAPYLATALRRQLGGELVHDHAPVSAPRAERYALYSVERAPLSRVVASNSANGQLRAPDMEPQLYAEATVSAPPDVEETVADEAWLRRVHYRLTEVVGEDGAEGLQDLLRDGPRPAHSGCPSDRLTQSRAVACVRIAQDPELRELLLEKDR